MSSESQSEAHFYQCRLAWTGASMGPTRDYESYSRDHRLDFEGKPSLMSSADPTFRGNASVHNPEDLLVAAIASCHFLTYVAICSKLGVAVIGYEDQATGRMEKVDRVMRFTEVVLRPKVTIAAGSDPEKARKLHEKAHSACFISSSMNFPVRHEPVIEVAPA